MLIRSAIAKIAALFATRPQSFPQSFTIKDACRKAAANIKRAGPVTSHVINIGPKLAGESERQRGEKARALVNARFPGCVLVLDVEATDYTAGKIVVLVADSARESKAC